MRKRDTIHRIRGLGKRQFLYLLSCSFLLFTGSCSKEKTGPQQQATTGVYVVNEGGYNYGNAEISFYDPAKQEVSNDIFFKANNYMLGDVAQSVYIKDSFAFVVVNNSQKIEVVSLPEFRRVRTITIPKSSPRYFLPLNDSIAYVTELNAGVIYVLNYQSGDLVKTIGGLSYWTEHLILFGNYVLAEERNLDKYPSSKCGFVAINTVTHSVEKHYAFDGGNTGGMVKDKNGRIWLATIEDTAHSINSSLVCLNSDLTVNKTIAFAKGHQPSHLAINGDGDNLYFFDDDVERVSIADVATPVTSFIARNKRELYGLGIDPVTEEVYVADALDYIQSSRVYRYNKTGQLVQSFTAGIITGNFTFRHE